MNLKMVTMYEQIMKEQIMFSIGAAHPMTLKEIVINLISNNEKEYMNINYAYLRVKHEIVG